MGQHKQALEIYVFNLKDYEKAEEYAEHIVWSIGKRSTNNMNRYCNHVHLTEDTATSEIPASRRAVDSDKEQPSIYLTLLSLYLTPPHGYKPHYGPALELLAKHGSRLPPSSALNLIPESLPVKELEFYFKGRMRSAYSMFNETQIAACLQKAENIKTQAQLLVGEGTDGKGSRSRHVTISEERICGICYKRLGASVINVFPDNTVVHLGCANRMVTA